MLTVTEAQQKILEYSRSFGSETVTIQEAYGRVLYEDIKADRDYPPFNRSAMDGYAILSADLKSKEIKDFKVIEEVHAGSLAQKKLDTGNCIKIMTGAPVPEEADAVIRLEDTVIENGHVHVRVDDVRDFQNIARKGEDLRAGEIILSKNQLLGYSEIGALAVVGKIKVNTYQLPKIAIISTGNEVVPVAKKPAPYQIRDSNSYVIESFLKVYNIPTLLKRLVTDDPSVLRRTFQEAMNADIIIVTGGVSMGTADLVPEVLESLGIKQIFHKVKIKPGKPFWFGHYSKTNVSVFALPGNPMSCQIGCKIFIEPFLRKCFGLPDLTELILPLKNERKKKVKFDEYFPCKVENNQGFGLTPIRFNGSGDVTSTLYSDGIALHPAEVERLQQGDHVKFLTWKPI